VCKGDPVPEASRPGAESPKDAYGVAVTATMMVDTLLTFFVIRYGWGYPLWLCLAATGFFMLIEGVFFAAALHKVPEGGWFPLALGAVLFTLMMSWRRGREALYEQLRSASVPLEGFLRSLRTERVVTVPGTAVFMTATPEATPHALLPTQQGSVDRYYQVYSRDFTAVYSR